MDIEYLLWLQGLREAGGNFFTPFMQLVSDIAAGELMLVPLFVYWCMSKRSGLMIIISFGISKFINGVAKLTVCSYRPWIRDARIIPDSYALKSAGGYSFPSGHTMDSAPVYGGLAVIARKKAVWVSWLCGVMIVLTALSRNYLGVHTPQDVAAGTLLALLSVYFGAKVLSYIEAKPERENFVYLAGLVLCVLALVYINVKPYPMDYVDGKLLVDPVSMAKHTYGNIGSFAGVIAAMFLERRYVRFTETGLNLKGVVLAVIGLAIYEFLRVNVGGELLKVLGGSWGRFVRNFSVIFFAVTVWPVVLKVFAGRE
ncbi:MAG: phosphatase PAP2 family protein [Synergistaceae bacterium]|nr:phosphatase PAP2 family protein [Synergistaceae bacterium]